MNARPATFGRRIDAIVIGASAGGVDVLSTLLPALPVELQAAVFVVLHQPPDRASVLVEIFGRKCALRVREAEDKDAVEPGTIYFAPPNYHLLVERGPRIALSVDDLVQFSRPSIDVLFQSAADAYRHHLLGILLTGWNEDGAAGLATISTLHGTTIVQDPESAEAPVMPLSAMRLLRPDFVLSPGAIADLLRNLGTATRSEPSPPPGSPAP